MPLGSLKITEAEIIGRNRQNIQKQSLRITFDMELLMEVLMKAKALVKKEEFSEVFVRCD